MKIIAHRGESRDAPENTLESFTLAWERGADGIEGDFHSLKDGNVVCMHDANAKRIAGLDAELASLDLTAVKALDVGSWKGPEWAGAQAPLLEEALATIPPGKVILVEIKDHAGTVERLARQVAARGLAPEQVVVISFVDEAVKTAKELLPKSKAFLLSALKGEDGCGFTPTAAELIARMRRVNADGLDCGQEAVTAEFVREIKAAGYEFHVWTVDDVDRARELIAMGVDSITSNCAWTLKNALQ